MGHIIDRNEYNKVFNDPDYAREQYMIAEPWLNILSERPESISRTYHQLALRQLGQEYKEYMDAEFMNIREEIKRSKQEK